MKAASSVFSLMSSRAAVFAVMLSCLPIGLAAQDADSAFVSMPNAYRMRMVGVGAVDLLDTYLSPESYKGTEVRFVSTATKPSRWKTLDQRIVHQGDVSVSHNRADNNDELAGFYNFQYSLTHGWQLTEALSAWAGGGVDVTLGFVYNTRNSNNPAQAKVSLNLAPAAGLAYAFHVKGKPWVARYEATAPLVGLMFSPNYGQSYYEIFNRGNYDHNVVPTTIIATPSLRQLLTLDLPLFGRRFVVGYLGDYQQAKVNKLKYHNYTHAIVLGVAIWK